jgi:hypothetical protein
VNLLFWPGAAGAVRMAIACIGLIPDRCIERKRVDA